MPRSVSLTSAAFARFRPTKRIQGRFFTLLVGPVTESPAKYACVISKKVAARATVRNTVKRRCREAIRGQHKSVTTPRTLVFYAKSSAPAASFADIQRDVKELLGALK